MRRTRIFLIIGIVVVASLFAGKFAPTLTQRRNLPPFATPEFIERHFKPQMEALQQRAETGDTSNGDLSQLFDGQAILGATIYTRYGEKSRSGIALKTPTGIPGAGPIQLPDLATEGATVVPWSDGSFHYERQFRIDDGSMRGFELILDGGALQSLYSGRG